MKKKYFVLAAIFLFNPIISIIDILPDFIGYYFLMRAFTPTSYIFDNASDAHGAIKRMLTVSAVKFFSVFLLFVTDTTMALVLSFTFAILEILYGFGAFTKIFDSTSYMRLRYDDEATTAKAEKIKVFSIVFLIAKVVLASLPDFTALTTGSSNLSVDLTRFRPILFIASAIIALVIGIIWFVRFTGFFKEILSDTLLDKIDKEYNEQKALRPGIFYAKDFMFAIKLLSIGVLFTFDLNIDSVNYILDGIFTVFCILAIRFLVKNGHIALGKGEKTLYALCICHGALSLAEVIAVSMFYKNNDPYYVYKKLDVFLSFLPIPLINIAEAVLLGIIIYRVFRLIEQYTVPSIYNYRRFFAERSVDGFVEEYKEYHGKLSKSAFTIGIISLVYYAFYVFMRPINENFVLGTYILGIVFIVSFSRAISYSSDRVYLTIYKYS